MAASLSECFPSCVDQEADEDVGLDAFGSLMPYGADTQVAFVNAKCGFGFGQLDVGAPEVVGAPVGDVAAQQVAPFAEFGAFRAWSVWWYRGCRTT